MSRAIVGVMMMRVLLAATVGSSGCGGPNAPSTAVTPPGNRVADPAPAPSPSLRDVDWRNRTYATTSPDQAPLTCAVRDGVGRDCPRLDGEVATATVIAVTFGDLTGDGVDEVVVVLRLRGDGPDDDHRLSAFTGPPDAPTLLEQIWVGPCPPGPVTIADGWIDLAVDGTWADCDQQNVTRAPRLRAPDDTDAFQRYHWDGTQLIDADGGRWQ